jgi:protein-tyrosine-phosphatase
MAEGLLRMKSDSTGAGLTVSSAGTWAVEGLPPTLEAQETMSERGIDISDVRSLEVSADLVDGVDLILVMTRTHREALLAEFDAARDRTLLFSELEGAVWDVEDPIGGTLDDYRATADLLERLMDAGWGVIARPHDVGAGTAGLKIGTG